MSRVRFRRNSRSIGHKQAIEDLKPMFDQNKETLARAEIEVEHLEKEVGTIQANLDREQKTIVSLRDSIKTGEIRLAGHVKDTESRAKAELANRARSFPVHFGSAQAEDRGPGGQAEARSRLLTSSWPICKSRSRPCWPSWPRSKLGCR